MAAAEPTRRRFVTRADIEDAKAAGHRVELGPRDVLTDEAATRARDLGVEIIRSGSIPAEGSWPQPQETDDDAALRAAIRDAVAAELGPDTPGLDAAIARVLGRRRH